MHDMMRTWHGGLWKLVNCISFRKLVHPWVIILRSCMLYGIVFPLMLCGYTRAVIWVVGVLRRAWAEYREFWEHNHWLSVEKCPECAQESNFRNRSINQARASVDRQVFFLKQVSRKATNDLISSPRRTEGITSINWSWTLVCQGNVPL